MQDETAKHSAVEQALTQDEAYIIAMQAEYDALADEYSAVYDKALAISQDENESFGRRRCATNHMKHLVEMLKALGRDKLELTA